MSGQQYESSVVLRFEKVASFYLDGIPKPFVLVSPDTEHGKTFCLSRFGFLPDYTGHTEVVFVPEFQESEFFDALCCWRCHGSSPSSRIGSHYSPYVGTFRISGKSLATRISRSTLTREAVRIPVETCEETDSISTRSGSFLDREADFELRAHLVIGLYAKDLKEYLIHDRDSMRRIVVLATQGFPSSYKKLVEHEISELKKLNVYSCCRAIYEYLCCSSLFRRILAPLCLKFHGNGRSKEQDDHTLNVKEKIPKQFSFKSALDSIKQSLFWNKQSNAFFSALDKVWIERLDKLVLFDTHTSQWKTDADLFLTQLGCSMRGAFTRLRIEFYTQVENMLFDKIQRATEFLTLDPKSFKNSELNRVFLATRILLTNRLRSMMLDALKDLVDFFLNAGCTVISPAKAAKIPVIEVHLVIGGCGMPRSPSFAQLRFGITDLLDELIGSANSLPTPETVILRALDLEKRCLNAFDTSEFPMKTHLLRCFDAAGCVIEDLAAKYSLFSVLPSLVGDLFTRACEDSVKKNISYLRDNLMKISKVSPDFVFFGCIAINCVDVKRWYTEQWSHYFENYLSAIREDVFLFLQNSIKKSHCYNDRLSAEPKTVEELEELYSTIKSTKILADEVRNNECKQVIRWFDCMENWQIPIDNALYVTALELMKCPDDLLFLAGKADALCTSSRPCIVDKLDKFRIDTRNKIATINVGIVELLGMFNLEVCDIAAQTCQELRIIVDEVIKAIEYISFCEHSLEVEQVDPFEDFPSLLTSFEVLEQFWGAVFDSTIVKNYYDTMVSNILAGKMIENVQRCRRLLHCSTRNLRAYSGLVCLGRQQEQVLSDFESLESLLDLITSPGLRKGHWKEITRLLGTEVLDYGQVDSSATLRYLLERGILDHIDKLKGIVDPALIDFETESTLEQMKSEAKKTRFIFESIVGCKDAFVLSPICRDSIYTTLESFIGVCRSLHNQASLSQFVVNSIREWEAACEKMRIALLHWKEIEQEWIEVLRYGMTLELIGEGEVPALNSREWKFLHEKIVSVNDIFSVYCATLQKRQYTLFTAMAQENVHEQITLACTILGDVKKAITSLLDAKREAFPRFCFLTDSELLSFLSVLNSSTFTRMLSKMYSRVYNVEIEDNAVVSFLTSDAAVLKAVEPMDLSPVPVERWMKKFDKTLRSSLLLEIQTCIKTYCHADSATWLQSSCSQVINMALRIIHYRDFRKVLNLAGSNGLAAYLKRLTDVVDEYIRLASGCIGSGIRRILFDAITFLLHSKREVHIAMKTGVQTAEDLDMTAMLQTIMEADNIFVQVLGLRLQYGLEFLGNYSLPVFTPLMAEKGLYSAFLSFTGGSFPIFIGVPEKSVALQNYAEYLGRFWWSFQCRSTTTLESVMQALRGAISVGAVLCLKDIGLVDSEVVARIAELIQRVSAFCASDITRQERNGIIKLSLEADGPSINVKRDPCFQIVFTSSRFEEIPTVLALAFRPIYLPHVDLTLIARGVLQSFGFSQCVSVGQRFAAMYEQFREVSPSTFTLKIFISVIHNAMGCRGGSVLENLGASFLNQFWPVVRSSNRLQKLLDWNAIQTLGIPNEIWDDLLRKCKNVAGLDTVLERFTALMHHNTNVILVGSPFSGKTKLWKQWARDIPFVVLSLRLLTCEDIYGSMNRKGILSSLAKEWNSLESQLLVIEGADVSKDSIVFDVPIHTRVRPFEGPDFVKGPLCRVIAAVSKLSNANPRIMSEFAIFTLSGSNSWKSFLKEQLHCAPVYHASTAYTVIVTVIDAILETQSSVNRTITSYESSFAVALRCSQFYKRWYSYAQSCCESRRVEWFTCEQAFALQCGVFATCWSLGLCLQVAERRLVRVALEKAHGKLSRVAVDIGFTEEVLPSMEDDILEYIATPMGWRKLGGPAEALGFFTPWSTEQTTFDLKRRTWEQFFAFPSRERILMTLELLINAGQPVLLVGAEDEGKSTILRHAGCNDQWVHHLVSGNVMSRVSGIQESLFSSLSLRQSKFYGPPIGRKLVLCVDDVHLPGTLDDEHSQAMYLFSFIDRHSALCPPSVGFVPVTDIVCVGASKPVPFELSLEAGVVRVQLPEMCDAEFSLCVGKFIEHACISKRPMEIAMKVTRFLEIAQAITLKVFSMEQNNWVDDNDIIDTNNNSNFDESGTMYTTEFPHSDPEVLSGTLNQKTLLELDIVRWSSVGGGCAKVYIPFSRRHLFLRASERAVQLLASSWIDPDAIANVFTATCALYTGIMDSPSGRVLMHEKLIQAGEATLQHCSSLEKLDLDPDGTIVAEGYDHDDTDLPPASESDVLQWISAYYRFLTCGVVEEPPYMEPKTSVVFAPPSQRAAADARTRRPTAHVTLLALPSSWLAALTATIHQAMRQEKLHVALHGSHDFNILRRALRIWGVAARIHIALLRDDYTNNPGGVERFKQDLVEVIRRTFRNDSRMVLFVPRRVTALPWAMGCIDTVVRSGDISQLFTLDEQLVLLYGHRETRRINGRLTAAEDLQLRTRICRRLVVVLHVESLDAMARLGAEYPLISSMLPIPLRDGELRRELVEALVNKVITKWVNSDVAQDIHRNSIGNPIASSRDFVNVGDGGSLVMGQHLVTVLRSVFDALAPRFSLRDDQLLEFSFQAQRLRHFLVEIRHATSRSQYILNLPTLIEEKWSEFEDRILTAIPAKKGIEELIAATHRRISEQRARGERYDRALKRYQKEATALGTRIRHETDELRALPSKVAAMLSAAESRVRALNAAQVKALASTRMPEKGVLLVRALYRVLGEDLRPAAVQDMWNRGRDIMTAPKFVQRLTAVEPANFSYESLALMHAALREVRYGEVSPYASAVADYIITFMDAVHVANGARDIQTRIDALRFQLTLMLSNIARVTAHIADTELRIVDANEELVPYRTECSELDALCDDMRQRQNVLRSLTDVVERFSPYHSLDEVVARDAETRGEAAVVFTAARLSLFGLAPRGTNGDRLTLDALSDVLEKKELLNSLSGMPTTVEESAIMTLFPSLTGILGNALMSGLSLIERMCLGSVMQGIFLRWPLFAGASPAFERVMRLTLFRMCGDVVVVSALHHRAHEALIGAARLGTGVLLCDVSAAMVCGMLRPLLVLRSCLIAAQERNEPVLTCCLFGEQVNVRTSFFLVCLSSAVIPSDGMYNSEIKDHSGDDEDCAKALGTLVCAVNLPTEPDANAPYHATLLLSVGDAAEVNDLEGMPHEEEASVKDFRGRISKMAGMLCLNLDTLSANAADELETMEALIEDISGLHTRVIRAEMHQQILRNRQQDAWRNVELALRGVERALQRIEVDLLGRRWASRKMDAIATRAADLPRPYISRIMPNTFAGLSDSYKEFYVAVVIIERAVRMFACGWPCELRGIFALYVLSSAVAECELIQRLRGELYESGTQLLNRAQFDALHSLLHRQVDYTHAPATDSADTPQTMDTTGSAFAAPHAQHLYGRSSDTLLREIAKCYENRNEFQAFSSTTAKSLRSVSSHGRLSTASAAGPPIYPLVENPVRLFFKQWMFREFDACDVVASVIYDTFFLAVKDTRSTDRDNGAGRAYNLSPTQNVKVHSSDEVAWQCMYGGTPSFARVTDIVRAVKYLRQCASDANSPHHMCHVSTPKAATRLMEIISECFSTRPADQGPCHRITAIIDPGPDLDNDVALARALALILTQFSHYAAWGARRGSEHDPSPVFLTCIMQSGEVTRDKTADPPMRAGSCAALLEDWCVVQRLKLSEPRFHLISLMERRQSMAPWRPEGAVLVLNSSTSTNPSITGAPSAASPLRKVPPTTIVTVPRRTTQPEEAARLSHVIELHVGIVSMQNMMRALWEQEGFGTDAAAAAVRLTIDDDDLALILRLTTAWVRRAEIIDMQEASAANCASRRITLYGRLQGRKQSLLDREPFNALRSRERLHAVLCKIAYGVYSARVTTERERLMFADMIRRVTARSSTWTPNMSHSAEETVRGSGTLEDTFLADLRHCSDDFLDLCGDQTSAHARREASAGTWYALFACPTDKSTNFVPFTSTALSREVDTESEQSPVRRPMHVAAPGDAVGVVFAWEIGHAERLSAALSAAGHAITAERVTDAVDRLRQWVPGDTLAVWFPALRRPRLLLSALAARAVSHKSPGTEDVNRVETVLVLLRRYSLLHDDVVLIGAALSELLEREVLSHTCWQESELAWRRGLVELSHLSDERPDDIVLAVRFQRCRVGDTVDPISEVLWEVRSAERRLQSARQAGAATPPQRGARPSVVFTLGGPEKIATPRAMASEIQSHSTIPVLCASPVVLRGGRSHIGERDGEASMSARVGCDWRFLDELPFLVSLTEKDWALRNPTRDESEADEEAMHSPKKAAVSVLDGSLGFFVSIS